MIDDAQIEALSAQRLRQVVRALMVDVTGQRNEIAFKQATIDKLTHELAVLKRLKFAAKSEAFNAEQKSLIEETLDADLAALALEIEQRAPIAKTPDEKQQPKRAALPANLPRREVRHEPQSTICGCGCQLKRIGQDVAEKLDYVPGVFTVERHVRGKWVCAKCQTLVQAAVPAHIIDKGIPTTGLLAQVLVAKYADHLPLYRQEGIFGRAGLAIARSTLAAWVGQCGVHLQPLVDALKAELLTRSVLHADETPLAMLKPGNGKTHRAYLWSYCTTAYDPLRAVVFDFADSRGGQHARAFLGLPGNEGWRGKLVCDDFSGYKACFEMGVTEAGCLAHARRKFHELWAEHKSPIGERALKFFVELYDIERELGGRQPDERKRMRQEQTRPVADALHQWLTQQRQKVPDGSATAKAIDYSLNRWRALTRFIDDGELPPDNNWVENQIRPIAIGRSNWLFAGSLRAGQRAAAIMSPGALGAAERARAACLPARRARAAACAAGQPHRRVAATSLATASLIAAPSSRRVRCTLTVRSPVAHFEYPSAEGGGFDYLRREVKLELGSLTDQRPTEQHAVRGHQLARRVEARSVADLGDDTHGDDRCDAT